MRRAEDGMKQIFSRDMKDYRAQEHGTKGFVWLIIAIILSALVYVGGQDYQECMAGNQSITLCGGGNIK